MKTSECFLFTSLSLLSELLGCCVSLTFFKYIIFNLTYKKNHFKIISFKMKISQINSQSFLSFFKESVIGFAGIPNKT